MFNPRRLIIVLLLQASAMALEDARNLSECRCDEEGWFTADNMLHCQMACDFLIGVAYFFIPLELLYFISCSNTIPFRWIRVQFGALIMLCGLTHFVGVWMYAPYSFRAVLIQTIFKVLTALVSCATAITLITSIPELLRVKIREIFLANKTMELDKEVDLLKRQEEERWNVRMLTQEIRSSLNRNTILSTTLVELAKALNLEKCTIWMPREHENFMELTHELNVLKQENLQSPVTVARTDPDVVMIKSISTATVLKPNSPLGQTRSRDDSFPGPIAAIRVPLLKGLNFKIGTADALEASYGILVLTMPSQGKQMWTSRELEIIEAVADQVAVALSHAALLEESQQTRDRLVDQNKSLQQARQDAMIASQACRLFQVVMNHEMRTPLHSISILSSLLQDEIENNKQRAIADMLAKGSRLLCAFVNDIMDFSRLDESISDLELHPFQLHFTLKEAAHFLKCMCDSKGIKFSFEMGDSIPNNVIGDEKRVMQIVLHTINDAIYSTQKGPILMRVCVEDRIEGRWSLNWRPSFCKGFIYLRFEIKTTGSGSKNVNIINFEQDVAGNSIHFPKHRSLRYAICKKFVQLMHGNIWSEHNSQSMDMAVTFLIRLHLQTSKTSYHWSSSDASSACLTALKGLSVLVVDDNNVNRTVTKRVLKQLGCKVMVASSGLQCLTMLFQQGTAFQLVFLDLCMPEMDGYEVAFRIRQKVPPEKQPWIVALTANTDKGTRDRCLHIGMNGLIKKPVLMKELRKELLKIMQEPNRSIERK